MCQQLWLDLVRTVLQTPVLATKHIRSIACKAILLERLGNGVFIDDRATTDIDGALTRLAVDKFGGRRKS